ncbi:hypothetical protein T484DRAFT_1757549 [Baffinella frigidus]|nr:hypothetical protein T484DRAFT_1757549 [Cryptophyta sp. CCMP2293]
MHALDDDQSLVEENETRGFKPMLSSDQPFPEHSLVAAAHQLASTPSLQYRNSFWVAQGLAPHTSLACGSNARASRPYHVLRLSIVVQVRISSKRRMSPGRDLLRPGNQWQPRDLVDKLTALGLSGEDAGEAQEQEEEHWGNSYHNTVLTRPLLHHALPPHTIPDISPTSLRCCLPSAAGRVTQ